MPISITIFTGFSAAILFSSGIYGVHKSQSFGQAVKAGLICIIAMLTLYIIYAEQIPNDMQSLFMLCISIFLFPTVTEEVENKREVQFLMKFISLSYLAYSILGFASNMK